MFFDSKQIDQLSQQMTARLPKSLQIFKEDIEKHFRLALETALNRLDLVSREEFDIQSEVLARTRIKLEALEKRVQHLEKMRSKEQPDESCSD